MDGVIFFGGIFAAALLIGFLISRRLDDWEPQGNYRSYLDSKRKGFDPAETHAFNHSTHWHNDHHHDHGPSF
jgi:hypothetical protein